MTEFEPQTTGVESDRSTNWATTIYLDVCGASLSLILESEKGFKLKTETKDGSNKAKDIKVGKRLATKRRNSRLMYRLKFYAEHSFWKSGFKIY